MSARITPGHICELPHPDYADLGTRYACPDCGTVYQLSLGWRHGLARRLRTLYRRLRRTTA